MASVPVIAGGGADCLSAGTVVVPAWLDSFRQPPVEYRPVPFWSWNERMEPEEVRRQVGLFAGAGWGGAFIHSRPGLRTPYLGEEWFAAVDAVRTESRRCGLKVWLYDEDGWPSGFSGGSMPVREPSFRIKVLIARPIGAPAPPGATPLGLPAQGVQVYAWIAPLGDSRYRGLCYVDLLDQSVIRRFLAEAYESYHRKYGADYGTLIVGEFFDEPRVVEHFGLLPAGPVPYSTDLLEHFRRMHGYDPTPRLHLLFVDTPESPRLRLHYYRTVSYLFEHHFARQLGSWCTRHGIALTGHFMWEESLLHQQLMGVHLMPSYRHMTIPGIDHLAAQIDERLTAKQCQSVVNQYGSQRMMSELYGAAGQALSFADRLWIAGQQLALGVNLFVPHLALYTMAGQRKHDHPPNLYYQQPWWPLNHLVEDRLARLSVALSQGVYRAEVLLVHPRESASAVWRGRCAFDQPDLLVRRREDLAAPAEVRTLVRKLDEDLRAVMDALFWNQRTFDLGDEQILADDAGVMKQDGQTLLRVGRMTYPVVILPHTLTLRPTTLRLLREFHHAGGRLLRAGPPLAWVDGVPDAAATVWLHQLPLVEPAQLPLALQAILEPLVELTDASGQPSRRVLAHVRDLPEGHRLVFLTHLEREHACAADVFCRGAWRSAAILDPTHGTLQPIRIVATGDGVRFGLPFAPGQCHLILLTEQESPETPVDLCATPTQAARALSTAGWKVERLDDNALTLDYARWRCADGAWSANPLPVPVLRQALNQQGYTGTLDLRFLVRVQELGAQRKVHLVVEYAESYHIEVNGRRVIYAGLPAWRDFRWRPIDITGLLHEGDNLIDLHGPGHVPQPASAHGSTHAAAPNEIDTIYLVGDFAVLGQVREDQSANLGQGRARQGLPPVTLRCFAPGGFVITDPRPLRMGDVTTQGLPFYAGRLRYTTPWPGDLDAHRPARLQVTRLDATVLEVGRDDQVVGHILAPPYQLDLPAISGAVLRQTLSLTLYNSLRNLLGPHHHPEGEPAWVGPTEFMPKIPEDTEALSFLEQWSRGQMQPAGWCDGYHVLTTGDLGAITLTPL